MTPAAPMRDNDQTLRFLREAQKQLFACASEQGVLRNIWKRAKGEGENTRVMRWVIGAMKRASPEEIIAELSEKIRVLQLCRIEVKAPDLFGNMDLTISQQTKQMDDLWDAYQKGYTAGRAGMNVNECPYASDGDEHDLHREWHAAWRAGQAAIARELGPSVEAAPATRRRPRQTRMEGTEHKQLSPRAAAKRKKAAKKPRKTRSDKGSKRPKPEAPLGVERAM